MKVGLIGEKLQIYSNLGLNKVLWSSIRSPTHQLTWYKVSKLITLMHD